MVIVVFLFILCVIFCLLYVCVFVADVLIIQGLRRGSERWRICGSVRISSVPIDASRVRMSEGEVQVVLSPTLTL